MTSPLTEAMARALVPWAWSDEPPEDYEPRQNGKTDAADIKDDWLAYVAVARAHSLAQAQAALKAISESGPTPEMIEAGQNAIPASHGQAWIHAEDCFRAMLSALPDTGESK